MEKQSIVVSCTDMLPKWCLHKLEEEFEVVPIGCLIDFYSLKFPKGKIIYVLGGQERFFGNKAGIVAAIAEAVIFIGEQPETFVDIPFFESKGIPVLKTGGGARAVAEKTYRQIASPDRLRDWAAKKSIWAPSRDEDVVDEILQKQSITIIGAGKIGKIILEKLADKVGKLRYAGGHGEKKELSDLGLIFEPDLIKSFEADVVSLHLSYGPETKEIIKTIHFEKILPWGCFINNARAEEIELEALAKIVGIGKAKGLRPDIDFHFDVFWREGQDFSSMPSNMQEILNKIHFSHHSAAVGNPDLRKITLDDYGHGLMIAIAEFKSKK